MKSSTSNPHLTLGLEVNATSDEVRNAYLSLVRQFPPDRAPDKFRAIHQAYQMLSDPLVYAQSLLDGYLRPVALTDIVTEAAQVKGRLPVLALLALGNSEST